MRDIGHTPCFIVFGGGYPLSRMGSRSGALAVKWATTTTSSIARALGSRSACEEEVGSDGQA